MALTQSLLQLRNATRRTADVEGTDALERHADADVNDAVNRGLAALYRILVRSRGDQRYLTQQTVTTVSGTSAYTLGSTCMHIITVEGTVDGTRQWFESFQPEEYPILADTNGAWSGRPFRYALRGATDIVFLPAPTAVYSINVWFVPAPTTLAADGDTFDTIARLDDAVVWYAARELATKDKAWDLVSALTAKLGEMRPDIEAIARSRDQNSPGRMVDEMLHDRTGRFAARYRRRGP